MIALCQKTPREPSPFISPAARNSQHFLRHVKRQDRCFFIAFRQRLDRLPGATTQVQCDLGLEIDAVESIEQTIADLENMRIRTPTGDEVPFGEVAEVSFGKGYSNISRLNRERTVTVSANIDSELVEPQEVIRSVSSEAIARLRWSRSSSRSNASSQPG